MAENYETIVKGFVKTINQCVARSEELETISNNKQEESARLLTEANEALAEKKKTDRLAQKLNDFLGE